MIAKKDKKADLERKRFAFFQIGLIVSGSLCLAAFEYSTANSNKEITVLEEEDDGIGVEIPPTYESPEELPEQTKVVDPEVDTFNIVKKLPKTTALGKKNEKIDVTEGSGMEEYGYGLIPEDIIYDGEDIDRKPSFVGGDKAMYEWISKQVQYPEIAAEMRIEQTVFVSFVVNKDGSINQVESLIRKNKHLEKEAIRVVSKMPKWIPGEVAGKSVTARYRIPFMFRLH
jgi:periplasmic protein TonB